MLKEQATAKSVSVAFTAVRFFTFALLLLSAGGTAALALFLGGATEGTRSRLWKTIAGLAGVLMLASLMGIVLEGSLASGLSLRRSAGWTVTSDVLSTRFGEVWLARALVALALVGAALALTRRPTSRGWLLGIALALAAALVASPAAAGHAEASGALSFASDVAHVGAAAVWLGGLAFLLLALWLERDRRWELASVAVPRFSRVAVVAVAILVLAGVINGYLQVRAWEGLWQTTYGRLLLAKVALLLPVLVLAAYNNRRSVGRLHAGSPLPAERRTFLRVSLVELGLLTAIVAVTAVLVSETPAKSQVVPSGPFATTAELGTLELNLVVDPARAGPNEIHLYLLTASGQPAEADGVEIGASLPEHDVGPFHFEGVPAGPGHFIFPSATLPFAGHWQLHVAVRRGKFEELDQTVDVHIH